MTKLYCVRHGETELNVKGVYYGATDIDLSEKGEEQCLKLGELLKNIKFDIIISSPLKRSVKSAEIITSFLGYYLKQSLFLEDDFKEINFGLWEGLHYSEVQNNFKESWDLWAKDWENTSPPQGEAFIDFFIRVKLSLEKMLKDNQDKSILIVAHQGVLRIIFSVLLNLGSKGFWNFSFDHGKYSEIEILDGHTIIKKINA